MKESRTPRIRCIISDLKNNPDMYYAVDKTEIGGGEHDPALVVRFSILSKNLFNTNSFIGL